MRPYDPNTQRRVVRERVFEPGGGGINVARAIAHLGGAATAIFPAGGATGEHLVALLAD
ncbi:PfkB family carbohydrate kinase, partial [Salmonella enterica subsp. enterica serovar Anatum]|nr:PfkB family carbohydrate kinase [Salmonella enterica subsp. enterica serovar Anatum]